MKYLQLHKLLWGLIISIYTLGDLILVTICWILYVIWNFKFPETYWRGWHTVSGKHTLTGRPVSDNNIWDTLKRRYNLINE